MKDHARASLFLDEQRLLAVLWPELEQFVNGPQPAQAWSSDADAEGDPDMGRLATDAEIMGPAEWNGVRALLTLLAAGDQLKGELANIAPRAPLHLGPRGWFLTQEPRSRQEQLDRFDFTVALLRLPALRPLLRQCDQCHRFFIRARVDRRPHSFCSPECRSAFHRALREPKEHREYMREYRRIRAKRRTRRKESK